MRKCLLLFVFLLVGSFIPNYVDAEQTSWTRGEFIQMLYEEEMSKNESVLMHNQPNAAIEWAQTKGILIGYDGQMRLITHISKIEGLTILNRLYQLNNYPHTEKSMDFLDVDESHWGFPTIQKAWELGILEQELRFNPKQSLDLPTWQSWVNKIEKKIQQYTRAAELKASDTAKYASGYNFEWHVTDTGNPSKLHWVGVDGDYVVAEYIRGKEGIMDTFHIGTPYKQLKEQIGTNEVVFTVKGGKVYQVNRYVDEKQTVLVAQLHGDTYTFFFDNYKEHEVVAILKMASSYFQDKDYFIPATEFLQESYEQLMGLLINQARAEEGLYAYADTSEQYNRVAREHNTDMITRQYFSHYTPEGLSPYLRYKDFIPELQLIGENLAAQLETVIHAHEGLMNSGGHRIPILHTELTHMFNGVDFNSNNAPYFTTVFYTPVH